ncbi:hypothetical protein [Pseudomonas putida]|uniref:hypothetical protein n=1 Tax=Pseudomonas putida TaxID=303 RepID=UPI0002F9DB54|nr:hypothetical protein [Pseudomonas putida]
MVDLQRGLLIINNQRLPYMLGLVPREQLDAINAKSVQESPLTYVSEGRQYVVAVVGGQDRIPTKLGDSIIAWALPEK